MSGEANVPAKIIEQQVRFLVPGMRLAKDILSSDDKVLMSKDTLISPQSIAKLTNWNINKVSIFAEVDTQPIVDPKIQEFIQSYHKSITVVDNAFEEIRATQKIPLDIFTTTAEELAEKATLAGNVIDQLYKLPECDDYTIYHSVNVSVISALLAMWLKYPPDIVNAISMAGLLHDIGKSQLSPEILGRPYKLSATDYAEYKKHAAYGYELASKQPGLAQSILSGIAHHHEREDGSGYPLGLSGQAIHPYAKIVAIADLYDETLTINRNPEIVVSPYTSLENLRNSVCRVDAKACITFIDNMTNYLSGNIVSLTDASSGRVVFINKDTPSRSMVQLDNGTVLDLSSHPDLRIDHILR